VPGNYTIDIMNRYDVSAFRGKKNIVLSTTNNFGAKNYFLALCYIVVGILSLIFTILFFL
jgi:hypothetical protein